MPVGENETWKTAVFVPPDPDDPTVYHYYQGNCYVTVSIPSLISKTEPYRVTVTDHWLNYYWEGQYDANGDLIDAFTVNTAVPIYDIYPSPP